MKPTKERFLGKGQFEKGGYEYEKQEQENKYLNSILKEADKEYDKIWSELGYKKSIPEFYHSQIFKAYEAGVDKTIERFATGDFIRGEEAEKFRQQAIAEERVRIGKELDRWFHSKDNECIEDAINRITGVAV